MIDRVSASAAPARILVVDDERYNRELLEVMLAAEGYTILSAVSGEQALEMVAAEAPDLILLDIMMPGMDGYQVATRVKNDPRTKSIPIIIFTALDDRNSRMHGLNAGAEDFLTKPVDRAELCVRVRNLLRLKQYSDDHDRYGQMLEGEVAARSADLLESVNLYRSTFDAAPVGIVHIGLDGEWLRANQRLADMLGYARPQLEHADVHTLLELEETAAESDAFRQMAEGSLEQYVVNEKRFLRNDGTSIWARVSTAVHRDAAGRPQRFISVIEDVTELRTLEAQLRQTGKMDAVGRLASGVAHDFNNLLTVIIGSAEVMKAHSAATAQHGLELGDIMRAAQSAAGLTKQLLAFSRQQVLNSEPLDVNALLTDMSGMLARLIGGSIDVSLMLAPDLALALADRGQLEQVVMNLIVNARDAMPEGGQLCIETTNVDLENSSFHDEPIERGSYVMVAVSDTGSGMTRETQRRLFEPFFTTKDAGKGTGLGLSTTYGIVKQSKGYIWIYSELGAGTTFKVYLPRAKPDAVVAAPIIFPETSARRSTETVLLVENEESVRRLVKRILDAAGFTVIEAANSEEAEQVYLEHDGPIDLVVTDMIMPGRGGHELIARLRERTPSLRALFMSGYSDQVTMHRAGIDTGQPFVQKPFTGAELMRHVRAVLDRP